MRLDPKKLVPRCRPTGGLGGSFAVRHNDSKVSKSVIDEAANFYRHYLGDANRGNLYYQTALGAGHSLVVLREPALRASTTARTTKARISTSAVMTRPGSSCATFMDP